MGTKLDDYYGILGLDPTATPGQVRAAFRLLALARHRRGATRIARQLERMEEAYEVLRSPELRQQYDVLLAKAREASSAGDEDLPEVKHGMQELRASARAQARRPRSDPEGDRARRMGAMLQATARRLARESRRLGREAAGENAPLLRQIETEDRLRRFREERARRIRRALDVALWLLLVASVAVLGLLALRAAP